MATLNLDFGYFRHPNTKKLIGILGKNAADIPLRILCHCGEFHPIDGRMAGYTDVAIENIVEYQGAPGECIKALLDVGFLDPIEGGYLVRDWNENQGHLAAYKIKSKKMHAAKLKKVREENVDNFSDEKKETNTDSSRRISTNDSPSDSTKTLQAFPMQGNADQVFPLPYTAGRGMDTNRERAHNLTLSDHQFELVPTDEEFTLWCSRVVQQINKENAGRENNKFVWISGKNSMKEDFHYLIYKCKEEDKRRYLLEAYNMLNGKLNWCAYVECAIMVTVRRSAKYPIKTLMGFIIALIKKPAELVGECVDGQLKGYTF